MRNTIIGLVIVLIVAGVGYYWYQQARVDEAKSIATYADCVAAGYPILKSNPSQCVTPDGRTLIEEVKVVNTILTDGDYIVNKASSTLVWEGRKKLVPGYVDQGNITLKSGDLKVVGGALASSTLIIDMKTIKVATTSKGSGADKLVTHLKSDDFFNVAKYPTAKFVLAQAKPTGEQNRFLLRGNLTIRDVTEPVEIPAMITEQDGTIFIVGEALVDRSKFNVKFGSESFFKELADTAIIEDNFKLIFSLSASVK